MRLIDVDKVIDFAETAESVTEILFYLDQKVENGEVVTLDSINQPDILTQIKTECEKHDNDNGCDYCKWGSGVGCVAREFVNTLTDEVYGVPCEWDIEEIRRRLADGKEEKA